MSLPLIYVFVGTGGVITSHSIFRLRDIQGSLPCKETCLSLFELEIFLYHHDNHVNFLRNDRFAKLILNLIYINQKHLLTS